MTFALSPLRLPIPNIRAVQRPLPALRLAPDPIERAVELDETCRPVPASHRDLTIPDVVPPQRFSWRRPPRVRGRAS